MYDDTNLHPNRHQARYYVARCLITLVTLGLGTTVATMASSAPWLITLSQFKGWMFLASGLLIALAGWVVHRSGRSWPVDTELAAACERADVWNRRFIWVSVGIWMLGFVAAYGLPFFI